MKWDVDQYERFRSEREAPFEDAFALIQMQPKRAVDLGCGTGGLSKKLAERLGCEILGIDSSSEMLKKAEIPTRQMSIEQFADGDEEFDLVFSHAALHWVPDHRRLIPQLLRRGRRLVVQMPSNHHHRAHQLIAEVAGWRPEWPMLSIGEYAELLWANGGRELTVYEKVYCHELPDADAILEWMRGTTLLPYLERTADPERLIAQIRERFRREFPGSPVMFGFRRTLFAATRV
jgi:trans-aconitate 2-methyltransferase